MEEEETRGRGVMSFPPAESGKNRRVLRSSCIGTRCLCAKGRHKQPPHRTQPSSESYVSFSESHDGLRTPPLINLTEISKISPPSQQHPPSNYVESSTFSSSSSYSFSTVRTSSRLVKEESSRSAELSSREIPESFVSYRNSTSSSSSSFPLESSPGRDQEEVESRPETDTSSFTDSLDSPRHEPFRHLENWINSPRTGFTYAASQTYGQFGDPKNEVPMPHMARKPIYAHESDIRKRPLRRRVSFYGLDNARSEKFERWRTVKKFFRKIFYEIPASFLIFDTQILTNLPKNLFLSFFKTLWFILAVCPFNYASSILGYIASLPIYLREGMKELFQPSGFGEEEKKRKRKVIMEEGERNPRLRSLVNIRTTLATLSKKYRLKQIRKKLFKPPGRRKKAEEIPTRRSLRLRGIPAEKLELPRKWKRRIKKRKAAIKAVKMEDKHVFYDAWYSLMALFSLSTYIEEEDESDSESESEEDEELMLRSRSLKTKTNFTGIHFFYYAATALNALWSPFLYLGSRLKSFGKGRRFKTARSYQEHEYSDSDEDEDESDEDSFSNEGFIKKEYFSKISIKGSGRGSDYESENIQKSSSSGVRGTSFFSEDDEDEESLPVGFRRTSSRKKAFLSPISHSFKKLMPSRLGAAFRRESSGTRSALDEVTTDDDEEFVRERRATKTTISRGWKEILFSPMVLLWSAFKKFSNSFTDNTRGYLGYDDQILEEDTLTDDEGFDSLNEEEFEKKVIENNMRLFTVEQSRDIKMPVAKKTRNTYLWLLRLFLWLLFFLLLLLLLRLLFTSSSPLPTLSSVRENVYKGVSSAFVGLSNYLSGISNTAIKWFSQTIDLGSRLFWQSYDFIGTWLLSIWNILYGWYLWSSDKIVDAFKTEWFRNLYQMVWSLPTSFIAAFSQMWSTNSEIRPTKVVSTFEGEKEGIYSDKMSSSSSINYDVIVRKILLNKKFQDLIERSVLKDGSNEEEILQSSKNEIIQMVNGQEEKILKDFSELKTLLVQQRETMKTHQDSYLLWKRDIEETFHNLKLDIKDLSDKNLGDQSASAALSDLQQRISLLEESSLRLFNLSASCCESLGALDIQSHIQDYLKRSSGDDLLTWMKERFVTKDENFEKLSKLKMELISQLENLPVNEESSVSIESIHRIVQEALIRYDADKTGMFDFALESAGGSVVSTRCTETYVKKTAQYMLLGLPLWYPSNNPRTAIQPGVHPGECWAFKGSEGYLVIQLSHFINPTFFSLEHIPKSMSPTGNIDSAPKDFVVVGLRHEKDPEPKNLGRYTYTDTGDPLQTFPVVAPVDESFNMIELTILSNHGNVNFTCLYRFRVHGTPTEK